MIDDNDIPPWDTGDTTEPTPDSLVAKMLEIKKNKERLEKERIATAQATAARYRKKTARGGKPK